MLLLGVREDILETAYDNGAHRIQRSAGDEGNFHNNSDCYLHDIHNKVQAEFIPECSVGGYSKFLCLNFFDPAYSDDGGK